MNGFEGAAVSAALFGSNGEVGTSDYRMAGDGFFHPILA